MTFEELVNEVMDVVQDTTWDAANIQNRLNRALQVVAKGVLLPGKHQLSPPLPELYTYDDIDTVAGVAMCNLPTDYQRDVVQVLNAVNDNIPLEKSFTKFLGDNPDQVSGAVNRAAVYGSRLLYRDIPATAETLTVHYYKNPTTMVNSSDEPTCLPEALHRSILVGYVCMQIFDLIEDGIEGRKINTEYWTRQFHEGLMDLEVLVEHDGTPMYIIDLEDRL